MLRSLVRTTGMFSVKRLAVLATTGGALSLGLVLVLASVLTFAFGWAGFENFLASVGALWSLTAVYWLPFVAVVGAPAYLLASKAHSPWPLSLLLAVVATGSAAVTFSAPLEQCYTSFAVRRDIFAKLTPEEAGSLVARRTLSDEFEDQQWHFPLSKYCPQSFDYRQNGEVRHVNIRQGEVFYGKGPVQ